MGIPAPLSALGAEVFTRPRPEAVLERSLRLTRITLERAYRLEHICTDPEGIARAFVHTPTSDGPWGKAMTDDFGGVHIGGKA